MVVLMKQKLLFPLMLVAASQLHAAELNIYSWEGYISEDVIRQWENKTGHSVNFTYYESDEARNEVLGTGRGQAFDLAIMDNISAQLFGKNNKLEALNEQNLPSLSHINQRWREMCGNFGYPYFWGTIGIVYNKNKVSVAPTSWGELLKPKPEYQKHIVMLSDWTDTLVPALLYENYSINTEDKKQLESAFNLLKSQAKSVLSYNYLMSYVENDQIDSEMYMALGYSGDQNLLNEYSDNNEWAYSIPKEGTVIWMDCFSVMSWSTKKEMALDFLNFINQPEIAAANALDIGGATANQAAYDLLPSEIKNDPLTYLPEETLDHTQTYRIISDDNVSLRHRIVNAVLKQHESE